MSTAAEHSRQAYAIHPVFPRGNTAAADAAAAAITRDKSALFLVDRQADARDSFAQMPALHPAVPAVRLRKSDLYEPAYGYRAPVVAQFHSVVLPARQLDARYVDREQTLRAEELAMPAERIEASTGVSAARVSNPLALQRTFSSTGATRLVGASLEHKGPATILGSAMVVPLIADDAALLAQARADAADAYVSRPYRAIAGGQEYNFAQRYRPTRTAATFYAPRHKPGSVYVPPVQGRPGPNK